MIHKRFFVYALTCPVSKDVVYVGQTANPAERLLQHRTAIKACNAGVRDWVQWLRNLHAKGPSMVLLERCGSRALALEREKAWIAIGLNAGWPLLNVAGARGGHFYERASSVLHTYDIAVERGFVYRVTRRMKDDEYRRRSGLGASERIPPLRHLFEDWDVSLREFDESGVIK